MTLEFVVPSELIVAIELFAWLTQGCPAAGNVDHHRNWSGALRDGRHRRHILSVDRKVMEEIGKGLGVH